MGEMKIGIIGCGVISSTYIRDIKRLFRGKLFIKAVADLDLQRAKETAEKYDIQSACSIDEILSDPEIELLVNLTPPKVHTELNRRILLAGKHVFCEKPFALSVSDAEEIAALAEEKGLQIGSAPDSFLGSSLQTCKKILDDRWIGTPLYVNANMMTCGVETWHPSPEAFYREGGGPVYDMGGYYFSTLVYFFGAAESVYAVSGKGYEKRNYYLGKAAGEQFDVTVPTTYAFIIKMKSGVTVTMNMSFDIWKSNLPLFEVYGTEGTLSVPDPNHHGGRPFIYRKEQTLKKCFDPAGESDEGMMYEIPELRQDVGEYVRGIGVEELARSIQTGEKNRVNVRFAIHVTELMTGIMESAETGCIYYMKTDYQE